MIHSFLEGEADFKEELKLEYALASDEHIEHNEE